MNCFEQDDPFMIDPLREDHIIEPSEERYNFTVSPHSSTFTWSYYIQGASQEWLLNWGRRGRLRLQQSSVRSFEMKHQWTDQLVEPNPIFYPKGTVGTVLLVIWELSQGQWRGPHGPRRQQVRPRGREGRGEGPDKQNSSYQETQSPQEIPLYLWYFVNERIIESRQHHLIGRNLVN